MAIITKRRKAYSVIYQKIGENGNLKTVWETYYDYPSAIARQKELEGNIDYDKINVEKNSKIIDFLKQYVIKVGPKKWSISYCEKFQGIINNYLVKLFEEKRIKDINDSFGVQTMKSLKEMSAIGKRHQKATKYVPFSMQRSTLSLLRNAFDYLVTERLITSNPFLEITLKAPTKTLNNPEWNLAYVENLFKNAQDVRLFLLVHILFSTGLGINEIAGLTWDNIHINEDLINSGQCFIRSDKVLKRMNMNSIATLPESQVIQKFKYDGFNQTNTSLVLMYKNPSLAKVAHLHQPVAMLLKEWKKQQEHYYSPANPHNLVIMLGSGKPCDIRNLTKMYHTACKNGRMKKLTLGTLKSFSKRQIDENGCTNADYFYSHLDEPILLPDLKKGTLRVMSMVTNQKINKKLRFDVFEKKNEDLQLFLNQLQDDPELKMQLIDKIKAEL